MKKLLAMMLTLALLAPAVALGETVSLPFGLKLGANAADTEAAFKADSTLASMTLDKEDSGDGTVEYVFEDVPIPGTELIASSLNVQVDCNNSAKTDRLTSVSFVINPAENSIAAFRKLLAAVTETFGAPESDPFGADAVSSYVEWGTLDAAWTTEDARVSLNLSRMYEESISLQYTSRLNYDQADLAE